MVGIWFLTKVECDWVSGSFGIDLLCGSFRKGALGGLFPQASDVLDTRWPFGICATWQASHEDQPFYTDSAYCPQCLCPQAESSYAFNKVPFTFSQSKHSSGREEGK